MPQTILIPSNYISHKHNEKYFDKSQHFPRLFCSDCHIDIVNDNYVKHFCRSTKSTCIDNFFGSKKHLLMNNTTYYKKKTKHVPHTYKNGSVFIKQYKLHKQSAIAFIVETTTIENNKTEQIYITIPDDYDVTNYQNKEELSSLVSIFN